MQTWFDPLYDLLGTLPVGADIYMETWRSSWAMQFEKMWFDSVFFCHSL